MTWPWGVRRSCNRHRSAIVSAAAIGQQGVDPRDAGTAGAVNDVFQQVGSALGVAVISTFVATATNNYLAGHGSSRRQRHRAQAHRRLLVGSRRLLGGCGHLRCPDPRRHSFHHEAGQPEPLDEILSGVI